MNSKVLSNDPQLKTLEEKILSPIWKTAKKDKIVPFEKFLSDNKVTEESLNNAFSDYYDLVDQIKKENPRIIPLFNEVMKDIAPEQRPEISVADIILSIDQKLHPDLYVVKEIRNSERKGKYTKVRSKDAQIEKLGEILDQIWKSAKNDKIVPFGKFLDDNKVTEESLQNAFSDYYDLVQQINGENSQIIPLFNDVMKGIALEQRPRIGVEEILLKIDQRLYPELYIHHPRGKSLDASDRALIKVLINTWRDEEKKGHEPFNIFLQDGDVRKSVDLVLTDSPEIDNRTRSALVNALEKIPVESRNDNGVLDAIIKAFLDSKYPVVTRFEKARIVGARALQISYGAPILVDYPDHLVDPIDIALVEYDLGIIPITVVKNDTV